MRRKRLKYITAGIVCCILALAVIISGVRVRTGEKAGERDGNEQHSMYHYPRYSPAPAVVAVLCSATDTPSL